MEMFTPLFLRQAVIEPVNIDFSCRSDNSVGDAGSVDQLCLSGNARCLIVLDDSAGEVDGGVADNSIGDAGGVDQLRPTVIA